MLDKWNVSGVMDCCDDDLCNQPVDQSQYISTTKRTIESNKNCMKAVLITGAPQLVPEHLVAMNDDQTCNKKEITEKKKTDTNDCETVNYKPHLIIYHFSYNNISFNAI